MIEPYTEKHYAWKCEVCHKGETESAWDNAIKSGEAHRKANPGHSVIIEASRRLVLRAKEARRGPGARVEVRR